jgi:hypothetical protein
MTWLSWLTGSYAPSQTTDILKDLGANLGPTIQQSQQACSTAFDKLSYREKQYLQEIIAYIPELRTIVLKGIDLINKNYKTLTVETVSAYLEGLLQFLRDPKFMAHLSVVCRYYSKYVLRKEHFKAVGAYIKCFLDNVDPKYKVLFGQLIDLVEALVVVCAKNKKMSRHLLKLHEQANKYIVAPINKTIQENRPSNAPYTSLDLTPTMSSPTLSTAQSVRVLIR